MSDAEVSKYLENICEFSKEAKKKYGDNGSEYLKNVLYAVYTNHSHIQEVYEKYISDAVKEEDFAKLKSVFYHAAKVRFLPCASSGYDHCDRLWPLLDLLACDRFDNIYRILPEGLPLSTNGYAMYVNGVNLIMCLLYNTGGNAVYNQDKVTEKAEKFAASKKPAWERAVVSCLLAIMNHDVSRFSESIQNVCESYGKMSIAKYMKLHCQNSYGLLALAGHFLSEEEFARVTLPEYKNFSKGYLEWFLSQKELTDELCVTYEAPLGEINAILKKPVAVTRIHQPYIDSDNAYLSSSEKKAWHMDLDRMMEEFLG